MVVAHWAVDGGRSPVRYTASKGHKSHWDRGLLLLACIAVAFGVLEWSKLQLQPPPGATPEPPDPAAPAATPGADTPGAAAQRPAQVLRELLLEVRLISNNVREVNKLVQAAAGAGAEGAAAPAAARQAQAQAQAQVQGRPPPQALPAGLGVHYKAQARSACTTQGGMGLKLPVTDRLVAPVVVLAYNRVHYLARTMATLLKHWSEDEGNAQRFPLFVSVDDGEPSTTLFAAAFTFAANVQVIHNVRDARRCKPGQGYCNLSLHYQMLMQLFFECLGAPRLILLEEDLDIAPDFFPYFARLAPLMDADPSVLCISAWNDHGQYGRASNATALYRTDIFPGLGWMTTAAIGRELLPSWPDIYWADWLRQAATRKGRQCVFPEVSRTHTFGRVGTSQGAFYVKHLEPMLINKERVDWAKQDVGYVKKDAYAQLMAGWLRDAEPIGRADVTQYCRPSLGDAEAGKLNIDLVTRYRDEKDFIVLANQLPPMLSDVRGGVKGVSPNVPRMGYDGAVVVRCRGRRLFIAPETKPETSPAPATDAKAGSSKQ